MISTPQLARSLSHRRRARHVDAHENACCESRRKPFHALARRQMRDEVGQVRAERWMPPLGCEVAQRQQHESALMKPRVRQDRSGTAHPCPSLIVEQIEIERTRLVAGMTHATETILDAV